MKIKKRNYVELFSFVAFVAIGFFLHFCNFDNSVFALTEDEENFFAQNNNLFYEPCATNESTGDGTIKISGNTAEEKVWSGLTSFLSEEQAAGVMGNLNHESGLNPIRRQGDNTSSNIWSDNASSGWALGLAQWDGTRRPKMLNYVKGKDSSLIDLFDASNYKSSADDFIADAGHEKANKLYMYEIEFLKSEIDKSYKDIYNLSGVSEVAMWFCEKVERPLSCANSRATKAQEYYDKFAGKTIVGDGENSAGSGVSGGTLTSSVHDKAWELANQTKEQSKKGPTAEYAAAVKSVGGDKSTDDCAATGESCDMFVATVLRASGVDTEVPFGAVSAQAEWFANHPEIYTEIEGDASDPNTYQPGDIRIRDGHVEIFGEKDGKAYILSASHCDRWAGYQDFFVESGYEYKIYRTSGQSTCTGQGNNSIAQTALDLAWPQGTAKSKWVYPGGSATEAYQKAAKSVGQSPSGINATDCGGFVHTVAKYSGALGEGERLTQSEISAKSDWEYLEWDKSDWKTYEQIQSGDIIHCRRAGNSQHWYIAAELNGELVKVEASRGDFYGKIEKKFSSASGCAHQYIIRYKGTTGNTSSTSTTSTTTSTTTTVGNGSKDIAETAWELAWPLGTSSSKYRCHGSRSTGCTSGSATEAFKKAINEVYPNRGWNKCSHVGASCDVFVGTVVRYSGADSKYPRGLEKGGVGIWKSYISKHPDLWEYAEYDPKDWKTTLQNGDIVWQDYPGSGGHTFIFLEKDGKYYTAEAGFCNSYGHINKVGKYPGGTGRGGLTYYFRYKGNTTNDNCDQCAQEEDNGTGLKEGGMTLEEAKKWMEAYRQEASKKKKGSYSFQGAYVYDAGCFGGTLNNCVAFSQWFLNKYTSIGPKWTNTVNGEKMVQHLGSTKGLKTGDEPRPYAIFSTGTYNHTGVVLGVTDKSIIVGEASCHGGYTDYWPGVSEWSLETAKSKKITYAYTDEIININGL